MVNYRKEWYIMRDCTKLLMTVDFLTFDIFSIWWMKKKTRKLSLCVYKSKKYIYILKKKHYILYRKIIRRECRVFKRQEEKVGFNTLWFMYFAYVGMQDTIKKAYDNTLY